MNKRKYFLLLWVMVCLLALLSCGIFSGESTAEPQLPDEVEDAEESGGLESLAEEAEDAMDDDEQPLEGVQEPEEGPSSDEDDASQSDASQNNTDSSEESGPTANTGAGWGESNSQAQTACDHPYFPMREGATWEYEDTEGPDSVWSIIEVNGDLQNATALMEVITEGITLTYNWDCSAGTGMVSFDYAGLTADTGDFEAVMNIEEGSGEYLPPPDDLKLGHVWDLTMKSVISITMDIEGFDLGISGTIIMTQTHEVVGEEPVIVNDITAPGVQVEVDIDSVVTMDMGGIDVPPQATETTEKLWLGYGIGLVREETLSDFGKVDLILKSFYIP